MTTTKQDRGWTVYQRGDDGAWCISFRVAEGDWKDRRIPREAAHTETQAEKWARANVDRLRAGEPTRPVHEKPALVLVRDLEEKYIEIRESLGLSPATMKQDVNVMKAHIVGKLGDVAVTAIDVACLLGFVDKLKAAGLGANSIRNVLSVFRSFLDVVQSRQLAPIATNVTRDPLFRRQGYPKRRRSAKPQLTRDMVETLLTSCRKEDGADVVPEHWKVRILVGCTTGLRDGEIAGLQWQDVDLDGAPPVLHVRKAVRLVKSDADEETGPTKNEGSLRDVPIHPVTVKALTAWKAHGWIEWVGKRPKPDDFVIPNEAGEGWRPRSAEALRGFLLASGLSDTYAEKPIDFHALRRSFATWLTKAGVERSVRKLLLGHVEGDVTEEHYIERDLTSLYEAVCRIGLDLTRAKVIAMPLAAVSRGRRFPAVLPAGSSTGAGREHGKCARSLAPPTRVERVTNGLGNRCSIL